VLLDDSKPSDTENWFAVIDFDTMCREKTKKHRRMPRDNDLTVLRGKSEIFSEEGADLSSFGTTRVVVLRHDRINLSSKVVLASRDFYVNRRIFNRADSLEPPTFKKLLNHKCIIIALNHRREAFC
jgi:hypothetical protein